MKFSMTFPWRRKPMGSTSYRVSSISVLCQIMCFAYIASLLVVPARAQTRIYYIDDHSSCMDGKRIINLAYGEKSAAIVKLRKSNQTSFGHRECHFEFKASTKFYVAFTFQEMDLPCSSFALKFVGDIDLVPDFVRDIINLKQENTVCGNLKDNKDHLVKLIGDNDRYVRYMKTGEKEVDFYFSSEKTINPTDTLTLVATAYKDEKCGNYYHSCSKNICIEEELRCDGYINCANGNDEHQCEKSGDELSYDYTNCTNGNDDHQCEKSGGSDIYSTTVGIVAGIILIAVAALVIFWWCGRQAKHDSREQRSRLGRHLSSGDTTVHENSPRLPSYNTVLRNDRRRSESPVPDNDDMPPPYSELFPENEAKQNQENLVISLV